MSSYYRSLVDFSLTLARHFLQDGDEDNYSASSTSIYLALAMVHFGGKNHSSHQLEQLLGVDFLSVIFPRNQESEPFLCLKETYEDLFRAAEIKNMLFTECHLWENYKKALINLFQVTFEQISFENASEAAEVINRWVREQTNGRINLLINESAISPNTVLILVNTIYFKSLWKCAFNKKLTHISGFHLSSSETINISFMAKEDNFNVYNDGDGRFRALSLEFQQDYCLGVFLLPNEHLSMKQLVSSLQAEDLQRILQYSTKVKINVRIPKFKLDTNTKVKKILQDLGVTDIFDRVKAELTSMSDYSLWVEDIFHRSSVEIDEKGVVAAASTAVLFSTYSLKFEEWFILDRPFIFIIIDQKTGIPLFMNIIYDPSRS